MTNVKHVDVFMSVDGGTLYQVGHFNIRQPEEGKVTPGEIATMLHQLAWGWEGAKVESATDAGVEDLGDNRLTPKPRKVTTPIQDLYYWEVAPGEFSNGTALQVALENYHNGQVFSEDQIRKFYPGSLWETY